jgi:tRNA(fMet)-specific endonuclease VapC
MYLLDTNICIDFIDGRSAVAARRVEAMFHSGLSISAITAAELLVGARNSSDPLEDARRIEAFIEVIRAHDFDDAAARSYARIAKQIGPRRNSFDRLIAAHALSLGYVLVTNDEKHFADVSGLRVENWTLA